MTLIITGNRIKDDLQKLGTIFNWEQEYFTLDKVTALHYFFVSLRLIVFLFTASIVCGSGSIYSAFRNKLNLSERGTGQLVLRIRVNYIRHRD